MNNLIKTPVKNIKLIKLLQSIALCLVITVSYIGVSNLNVKANEIIEISTAQELVDFVSNRNQDVSVELTCDIVFDEPIACDGYIDAAVQMIDFNGNNYTIKNFAVIDNGETTNCIFQRVYSSKIYNLNYEGDCVVSNQHRSLVGALAKRANYTNFENVSVKGKLTYASDTVLDEETNKIGSFVGESNYSNFSSCENNMNIYLMDGDITRTIGGIVGYALGSNFDKCINNGIVQGGTFVGGIIGNSNDSNLSNCSNNGTIFSKMGYGAGLVSSFVDGNANNCINSGDLMCDGLNYSEAGWYVGGLFSKVLAYEEKVVSNCVNNGRVYGGNALCIGGITGESGGSKLTIINCVNKGDISHEISSRVGGIVGCGGFNRIEKCINYGDIQNTGEIFSSEMEDKGGIVGWVTMAEYTQTIIKCINEASIKQWYNAGGIVGKVGPGVNLVVDSCINNGNVEGYESVGGLVGYVDIYANPLYMPSLTIINSYNAGQLKNVWSNIDGFVGNINSVKNVVTIDSKSEKQHKHVYVDLIVKKPTATEEGIKQHICSVCGYVNEIKSTFSQAKTDSVDEKSQKIRTVKIKVIKLKASKKKVKVGKTLKIKATISPKNVSSKKVKWSVSNKKYASISKKGVLKAKKAGKGKTVTVKCKALDGSKKTAKIKIKIV